MSRSATLLIVDAQPIAIEILRNALDGISEIVIARGGIEALTLVATEPADVIFLNALSWGAKSRPRLWSEQVHGSSLSGIHQRLVENTAIHRERQSLQNDQAGQGNADLLRFPLGQGWSGIFQAPERLKMEAARSRASRRAS